MFGGLLGLLVWMFFAGIASLGAAGYLAVKMGDKGRSDPVGGAEADANRRVGGVS